MKLSTLIVIPNGFCCYHSLVNSYYLLLVEMHSDPNSHLSAVKNWIINFGSAAAIEIHTL